MWLVLFSLLPAFGHAANAAVNDCVVLLHGLARISNSMGELERKLERSGFEVVNIKYPSRQHAVTVLAADAVGRGVAQCREKRSGRIHFVTHSLGGILLRVYVQEQSLDELGRVVMLGPPNQGSELVDALTGVPGFGFFGPAGKQLGTGEESILHSLGAVDFELGVIAGCVNINPLALFVIDGPNDSIVSVASTRVAGMAAHITLPVMHSVMMRDNEVIEHSIHFLQTGEFLGELTD
ncbi:MAG: hypothetical protein RQ757_06025 [Pseudomonadales bacterium]|nr:hypothetical protein [Pseudomonadales bacterium]